MAYRLTPLPAAADEPAQAYACRLARRINLPLRFFCTDIGILRQEVIKGSTDAVHRIADYGGADPAPLLAATVQHTEGRLYTLNGQDLVRDSLRRTRLRGCVMCMKEQLAHGAVWDVSIRTSWCLASVYTCPIHEVGLVDIGTGKDAMFNEWSLLMEDFLSSDAEGLPPPERSPGKFELYLMERAMHGPPESGGEVNELPMHVAMRVMPFIGQTLLYGTNAHEAVTDDEIIKACDTGFQALVARAGLEQSLAEIEAGAGPRMSKQGPQHRLGKHLFSFLMNAVSQEAYQPLIDRVRTFVLDTIPLDRGSMLLGRPVDTCRVHSVATLTAVTGMHPTTLRRYLRETGFLKSDAQNGDMPMPAAAVEAWAASLTEVVGQKAVEELLGCSRSHFNTLLKARLIQPSYASSSSRKYRFGRTGLEALLTRLLDAATPTPATPDGFVGLDRIGKLANASIAVVLKAVIAGEMNGVTCRPCNRRLDGLEFNVQEAKALTRGEPLPGLPANELLAYWKMHYAVLRDLIGAGYLPTQEARHPIHKGMIKVIPYEAIEQFERTYVLAWQLADSLNLTRAELRRWLADRHVPRAFDQSSIDAAIYRRSDLPL